MSTTSILEYSYDFSELAKYLGLVDLRNLSQTSKSLLKRCRKYMFARYRWKHFNNPFYENPENFIHIQHLLVIERFSTLVNFTSLKYLEFCSTFDYDINGKIPHSVEYMRMGDWFYREIKTWPKNLTRLEFGRVYSSKLSDLPQGLTHLRLANVYNESITNLPPTLKHLICGFDYDKPIIDLPQNLTHLTFGWMFNKPVDGLLPPTLTHLTFGYKFNQPVDHLPPSITHLVLSGAYFRYPLDKLPPNIVYLELNEQYVGEHILSIAERLSSIECVKIIKNDHISNKDYTYSLIENIKNNY